MKNSSWFHICQITHKNYPVYNQLKQQIVTTTTTDLHFCSDFGKMEHCRLFKSWRHYCFDLGRTEDWRLFKTVWHFCFGLGMTELWRLCKRLLQWFRVWGTCSGVRDSDILDSNSTLSHYAFFLPLLCDPATSLPILLWSWRDGPFGGCSRVWDTKPLITGIKAPRLQFWEQPMAIVWKLRPNVFA